MTDPDAAEGRDPSSTRYPLIVVFASHWLSKLGLGLVLTAIVLWASLFTVSLRHGDENPYIGLAMLGVAGLLVIGAVITPIGLLLGRRRLRERIATSLVSAKAAWGRFAVFLLVVSVLNLLISTQAGFRVAHAMETTDFCGSCHVMTPESRAFDQGPHASLLCVDCHVGEGAKGLIKSKLQGLHQLHLVLTDNVPKPIKTAIASGLMVPSAETCERCHWKEMPASASLEMIVRYGEDEANTPETTLLTMNVGGSRMGGIHGAHHGEGVEIRFVAADAERSSIPLVEYVNETTGVSRTYVADGASAADFEGEPRIVMQCFDCHNRAAHTFLLPDRAVDRAMLLGRMSASLPFLKKKAVEILKAGYRDSAAAAEEIPAALTAFYRGEYPDLAQERAADVDEAASVLADIYSRNVFPELGVDWGTYPDHRGHEDSPGCFRCHGGDHTAETGETITNDCFACHFPSAVEAEEPEVLDLLGIPLMLRKLERR